MGLEIFHIFDPLKDQQFINTMDIIGKMIDICKRQCGELPRAFSSPVR
jgi:hypothetical protein